MDRCPLTLITPDIWTLIELAEFMKRGLPPVAGGTLDQAQAFLDACRFIWAEQRAHRGQTIVGIFEDGNESP